MLKGFLIDNRKVCLFVVFKQVWKIETQKEIFLFTLTPLLSGSLACVYYTVSGMHQSVFEIVSCPHSSE